jgi:hypothetical protein
MLQIFIPIASSIPQAKGAWVAISVRGINANIVNYAFPIPGIWARLRHANGSAKTNHNGAGGNAPWLSGAHVDIICPGDHVMKSRKQLILSAVVVTFSTQPSLASSCSQDIDRAWVQVNTKIQARAAAGRSAPQGTIALLHHQPTPSSIAAAEETLVDTWLPIETAVAALARARQADGINDRIACEGALADVQRVIGR